MAHAIDLRQRQKGHLMKKAPVLSPQEVIQQLTDKSIVGMPHARPLSVPTAEYPYYRVCVKGSEADFSVEALQQGLGSKYRHKRPLFTGSVHTEKDSNYIYFLKDELRLFMQRLNLTIERMLAIDIHVFEVDIERQRELHEYMGTSEHCVGRDVVPSHPFEVYNPGGWDGYLRREAVALITHILSPALKKKVMIENHHGKDVEYSARGAFRVLLWASPYASIRNRGDKAPAKIWDIPTSCRDSYLVQDCHAPVAASQRIMSGEYVVAELFANALYIYHDIVHCQKENELRILEQILLRARALACSPEEYAALEAAFEVERRERQVKLFTKFVTTALPARAKRHEDLVKATRVAAETARRDYLDIERRYFEIVASHTDPAVLEARLRAEIERLQSGKVARVTSISLEEGGEGLVCKIYTDEMRVLNPRTNKVHILGRACIVAYLAEKRVRILNLDRTVTYGGGYHHFPHVGQEGRICMGNTEYQFGQYLAHYELEALVTLAIIFLESIQLEGDAWSQGTIDKFPILETETMPAMAAE
jgi:hypothetical protein